MGSKLAVQQQILKLHELYSDSIYQYAFLTLGNATDAMDIVQEVFLRAFRSWHTYRQDSNARTWLMSIARNYMKDQFRKRRYEKKLLNDYSHAALHKEYNFTQSILEVEELLSKLKPSYRQVVILRYINDLTLKETAKILGWSEAKVRVTANRALKKLRDYIISSRGGSAYDEPRTRNI